MGVSVTGRPGAPLVLVVMPCLNRTEAIGPCIERLRQTFATAAIEGETAVCDNGSTDASVFITGGTGARAMHQPLRGYGNGYLKGFADARGRYLVVAEEDDTYDSTLIPEFLPALDMEGHQFVSGSRNLDGNGQITTCRARFEPASPEDPPRLSMRDLARLAPRQPGGHRLARSSPMEAVPGGGPASTVLGAPR